MAAFVRILAAPHIEAHLLEVYGVKASRELTSNVTDVVVDEIEIWRNRPVILTVDSGSAASIGAVFAITGAGADACDPPHAASMAMVTQAAAPRTINTG